MISSLRNKFESFLFFPERILAQETLKHLVSIHNLTKLTDLSLKQDELTGCIPRELSQLSGRTTLDVPSKKFSGTFVSFPVLKSLKYF